MKLIEMWRSKTRAAQQKKREAQREEAEAEAIIQGEVARLEAELVSVKTDSPPKDHTKKHTIPAMVKAIRDKWIAEKGQAAVQRLSGHLLLRPGEEPEVQEPAFPEDEDVAKLLYALSIVLPALAIEAGANLLDAVSYPEGLPLGLRLARYRELTGQLAELRQDQTQFADEQGRQDLLPAAEQARRQHVRERHARWTEQERLAKVTRVDHGFPHQAEPEPERPA